MLNDVQDIMEVDRRADEATKVFADAFSRTSKVTKTKPASKVAPKPAGMPRELYNLIKSDADSTRPIGLSALVPTGSPTKMSGFKTAKVQLGRRRAHHWQWVSFNNTARKDGLKLSHWTRSDKLDDEYPFAKFNKTLRRLKYTDAEYEAHLCHPVWTREATDHLFALADQYSLRWVVIADRFDRTRFPNIEATVEDCKQRYYDSFNVLAVAAAAGTEPTLIHYDADHNRRRKVQLEHLWRRTQVEIDEENELLVQLKHIETRKRERERKAADLQKLIAAAERAPLSPAPVAIAAAASLLKAQIDKKQQSRLPGQKGGWAALAALQANDGSAGGFMGIRFAEQKSAGAHLRSAEMKLPNIGQKKFKAIEHALNRFDCPELNARANPNATAAISAAFNDLRSDMSMLHELHNHLHTVHFSVQELRVKYAELAGTSPFELSPSLTAAFEAADRHVAIVASSSLTTTILPPTTQSVHTRTSSTNATPQLSPTPTRETTPQLAGQSSMSAAAAANRARRLHGSTENIKRIRRS